MLIMLVSIYTSRVILDKLGIDDYGIYNAVASVIAIMEFLKFTLSTSSSRYITYAIGQKKDQGLTFSTVFYSHLFLALFLVLILETAGLLYLSTTFVIPAGRETAVHIVYQISIVNTALAFIQIPYTSAIIANERMNVYAIIGVVEAFMRLAVVYILSYATIDRLVFYALLVACVQLCVNILYVSYSIKNLPETRVYGYFSKSLFSDTMRFSGWTLIANISNTIIVQGPVLLLNLFFAPAIIASKALASQITTATMQFVGNFRTALNPQIIKSYAAGEFDESKKLSIQSTTIVFDMLLLLGLPCVFIMRTILSIWLVEVPPLAVEFAQIAILAQIIESISSSLYIPFVASGKLRFLSIVATVTSIIFFLALYLILKAGGSPLWTQYLYLITCIIASFVIRPWLLCRELDYKLKELIPCFLQCLKVLVSSCVMAFLLCKLLSEDLFQQIILAICIVFIVLICSFTFADAGIKALIVNTIKMKIHKV